jgi:hypothetical protein
VSWARRLTYESQPSSVIRSPSDLRESANLAGSGRHKSFGRRAVVSPLGSTMGDVSKPEVTVWIRDGIFGERAGIEGWVPADTGIRASSLEALTELAEDLAEVGIVVRPTIVDSVADVLASGEAMVTGAGLASLAAALRTWLRRNDGKRVRIDYNGRIIDIKGMGAKEIEQVLAGLSQLPGRRRHQDHRWR